MNEFKNIIVPYDFSDHSNRALEFAIDLARRLESKIHLVHIFQAPAMAYGYALYGAGAATPALDIMEIRQAAAGALQDVADKVKDVPKTLDTHVFEGSGIADAVREAAETLHADLIVMGTHGRTGLAHVFLGSVAERTLRHAPCPVVTVQAREKSESQ